MELAGRMKHRLYRELHTVQFTVCCTVCGLIKIPVGVLSNKNARSREDVLVVRWQTLHSQNLNVGLYQKVFLRPKTILTSLLKLS